MNDNTSPMGTNENDMFRDKVQSSSYPAMNRRAIVTDALPAPRLSACAKALADRRQAGLERGTRIGLSWRLCPWREGIF